MIKNFNIFPPLKAAGRYQWFLFTYMTILTELSYHFFLFDTLIVNDQFNKKLVTQICGQIIVNQ
jgi:hypothetical protein